MIQMCKLAHVTRYAVLSQYFHFCCFRSGLIYDCEAECSSVYLTVAYNDVDRFLVCHGA